jgi:hypothetical protein
MKVNKMPVTNFRITKIHAEKNEYAAKDVDNVNVSSNFLILTMSKKKDREYGDYLQVKFRFNIGYKPALGGVDMDGYLWFTDKKLDQVAVEKEGKMHVENEAMKEISTMILRDCLLEAVDITRKLKLPLPINLPKVDVKPKEVNFPLEVKTGAGTKSS